MPALPSPTARDVDFGGGRLLDLHVPSGDGPFPVITWCRGSGWLADNGRQGADRLAQVAGPAGFAVAGVTIRSSAQAVFPAQRDDIADALEFLRTNGSRYGIDGGRIVTAGESSGGWAAAMGALTTDLVSGSVTFYPPTDLLAMDSQMPPGAIAEFAGFPDGPHGHDHPRSPESKLLGGTLPEVPETARAASPLFAVHPAAPPFLVLHGGQDRIVPPEQGRSFAAALAAAGVPVDLHVLPAAGHGGWDSWFCDATLPDTTLRDTPLRDTTVLRGAEHWRGDAGRLVLRGEVRPSWETVLEFCRRVTAG